ncbi:hypothetical protein AALP_AA2G015500 [Arabis alpina]|uniref:Uncharacterized protein n=2 Tax=Arabis alpina TaxID=50452 RepID=A0A087HEN8_ARAAL|nr:hypothetical protein AALP_AA2G015500 [Arabis alpina]
MQVTDMKKITLHGCVHALLVWVYEAVPILGERFGRRREGGVPMLCWGGSRVRYNLEQVMEEDKKSSNNNKVCIRHLVVKPLEFIYPTWIDAEDFKLNNMIRDILGECMDEDFWELDAPVSKKKKSKTKDDSPDSKKKKNKAKVVEESEDDDEDEDDSPVEKKKKIKKSKKIKAKVVVEENEDEDDSPAEKKEKKKEKEKVKHGKRKMRSDTSGDEDSEEECDLDIQIKNIPKLKKKKETEGGDIAEVLKVLQGMASTIASFDTRLTSLEGKGNVLKAVVDEQSNTGVGGDVSMEEDDLVRKTLFYADGS